MYLRISFLVLALLNAAPALAVWACVGDADCGSPAGSVCSGGACVCPAGQQAVGGGARCVDAAPYVSSPCAEHFQCARLTTGYECRLDDLGEGTCHCQPDFHYFRGRCWPRRDFGETCQSDEECLSTLTDPYGLACVQGLCACADHYYLRQRGECRRIGYEVGDECVLDVDCQFENGACDFWDQICYDALTRTATRSTTKTSSTAETERQFNATVALSNPATRQFAASCSTDELCASPFTCSGQGHCICPVGYYHSADGTVCLAELSSPATSDSCVGLFARVEDGICRCPANFFYHEDMRDCVKATARFGDSCATDANCFTFGAAGACGAPQEPWGLRGCECDPALAVPEPEQNMCRLFSALGEVCEDESDCLAGELQVLCSPDAEGVRRCSCPDGTQQVGALCLTAGLGLGDQCQVTEECSADEFAECVQGVCECGGAYFQNGDACEPGLGGECSVDANCVIEHTSCQTSIEGSQSCQCEELFVEHEETCLPESAGLNATCEIARQCQAALGEEALCAEGVCACGASHHYRNERCWPITGLLETCSREGQCYLGQLSERVVCRNEVCQCDFLYPYSDELHTCVDSAATRTGLAFVVAVTSLVMSLF